MMTIKNQYHICSEKKDESFMKVWSVCKIGILRNGSFSADLQLYNYDPELHLVQCVYSYSVETSWTAKIAH